MNLRELFEVMEEFNAEADSVLKKKGADYNPGGMAFEREDFIARLFNIPPEVPMFIHLDKHYNAVCSFVMGREESEPIRQRLIDLRNYCVLFAAMLTRDRQQFKDLEAMGIPDPVEPYPPVTDDDPLRPARGHPSRAPR